MKYTLIIAGSGGQGVMSIGITFAQSAAEGGKHASFMPTYGPEQRGGSAKCTVIISDEEIISPLPKKSKVLIAMNEQSYKKFIPELEEGGLLIINSSRVTSQISRADIKLISIPADDIALDIGDARISNIILIGALLGFTDILQPDVFLSSIEKKFAKKSPEIIKINKAALDEGVKICNALK
ncbi:MAG: hypothetical protein GYA50_04935 [Eubacteriaceae bacterium]|nr:hypothetical protein [Eubacteriaceae bacterium]